MTNWQWWQWWWYRLDQLQGLMESDERAVVASQHVLSAFAKATNKKQSFFKKNAQKISKRKFWPHWLMAPSRPGLSPQGILAHPAFPHRHRRGKVFRGINHHCKDCTKTRGTKDRKTWSFRCFPGVLAHKATTNVYKKTWAEAGGLFWKIWAHNQPSAPAVRVVQVPFVHCRSWPIVLACERRTGPF